MEDEPRLITTAEAREVLGVSKPTMARLLKEGHFKVYQDPKDHRVKLLDAAEVARGPRPRLISSAEAPEGKMLAAA